MRRKVRVGLSCGCALVALCCLAALIVLRAGRPLYYTDGAVAYRADSLADRSMLVWQSPEVRHELPGPIGAGRIARLADGRLVFARPERSSAAPGERPTSMDLVVWDPTRPQLPPLELTALNTRGSDDIAPAISADGRTLFFASDREGGAGGYDIWAADYSAASGTFGSARELGEFVNGPADELDPAPAPRDEQLVFVRRERGEPGAALWIADLAAAGDSGVVAVGEDGLVSRAASPLFGKGAVDVGDVGAGAAIVDREPAFSPDGTGLWFVRSTSGVDAASEVRRTWRHDGEFVPSIAEPALGSLRAPAPRGDGFVVELLHFDATAGDALLYAAHAREVYPYWAGQAGLEWVLWLTLWMSLLLIALLALGARWRQLDLVTWCILLSLLLHWLALWLFGGVELGVDELDPRDLDGDRLAVRFLTSSELAALGADGASGAGSVAAVVSSLRFEGRSSTPTFVAPATRLEPTEANRLDDLSPTSREVTIDEVLQGETLRSSPSPVVMDDSAAPLAPSFADAEPNLQLASPRALAKAPPAPSRAAPQPARAEPKDRTGAERGAGNEVALRVPASALASPAESLVANAIDRAIVAEARRAEVVDHSAPSPHFEPTFADAVLAPAAVLDVSPSSDLERAWTEPRAIIAKSAIAAAESTARLAAPQREAATPREAPPALVAPTVGLELSLPSRGFTMPQRESTTMTAARGSAPRARALRDAPTSAVASAPRDNLPVREAAWTEVTRPRDLDVAAPSPEFRLARSVRPHGATMPVAAVADRPTPPRSSLELVIRDLAQPHAAAAARHAPELYQNRTGPARAAAIERFGGSAETERAVADGLAYLASMQRRGGHWGNRRETHSKYGEVYVGKSALCLLAFLGAGHTHRSATEYSIVVEDALHTLLDAQDAETGHFGSTSSYSHGIATYAIAECHAMTGDAALRAPLERAVAWILRQQKGARSGGRSVRDDRGGWGYFSATLRPEDNFARTSVSAWMLMALKSAAIGGIEVSEQAFDDAESFLRGMFDRDHQNFLYSRDPSRLGSRWRTLPASTPAAAFCLMLLGADATDPQITAALDFTIDRKPRSYARASTDRFVLQADGNVYFWYYGSLAAMLAGGATWQEWNDALKSIVVPAQSDDGSFAPIGAYAEYAGDVVGKDHSYTTAMVVLSLEVYYRYFTPLLRER